MVGEVCEVRSVEVSEEEPDVSQCVQRRRAHLRQRELHGREAFASNDRLLEGCYVDADGVWSELAAREARV